MSSTNQLEVRSKETPSRKEKTEINRVQKTTGATRKTANRKMRAVSKAQAKMEVQAVKETLIKFSRWAAV